MAVAHASARAGDLAVALERRLRSLLGLVTINAFGAAVCFRAGGAADRPTYLHLP